MAKLLAAPSPFRLPRAVTSAALVVLPRRTRGGGSADAGRRQLLGGGRGAPVHRRQFLRTMVDFYHAYYAIPVCVLNPVEITIFVKIRANYNKKVI